MPVDGIANPPLLPCRLYGPRLGRQPHSGGIGHGCEEPCPAKKQYDTWTEEDEAGYQLYFQELDMEKRTYRAWYLIANPRSCPRKPSIRIWRFGPNGSLVKEVSDKVSL